MLRRLSKRAQTTAEYAILIALVVGAVIAMQIYVRRSIQGKIKDAADYKMTVNVTGVNTTGIFATNQFEPYYINSTATTDQKQTQTESMRKGGGVNRTTNATTTVQRNQTVN